MMLPNSKTCGAVLRVRQRIEDAYSVLLVLLGVPLRRWLRRFRGDGARAGGGGGTRIGGGSDGCLVLVCPPRPRWEPLLHSFGVLGLADLLGNLNTAGGGRMDVKSSISTDHR